MKKRSFSVQAVAVFIAAISSIGLNAQPEFRSDVQKEFDENGNITRDDSTWSWSLEGGPSINFDSLFMQFLEDHPFTFEFDWDRLPSWNDSILDFGGNFNFHFDFPDPLFNEDFFRDFFQDHPFPDFEELFNRQMEMMQHYFHSYPFHGDSLRHFNPGMQSLPGQQKKSPRTIDI